MEILIAHAYLGNLCLPFEELESDVHAKIENANVQFTR